jgi:hypothetical protein
MKKRHLNADTLEDFIRKAKNKHGNLFDYSLVKYKNGRIKVSIICKQHGIFKQTPENHKSGQKCPFCRKNKDLTTKDFITRAVLRHGNLYSYKYTRYKNIRTQVKIRCSIHGIFKQTPLEHLQGCGCQKCARKNLTNLERIKEFRTIHGNKYNYSKYTFNGWGNKSCVICKEHGEFLVRSEAHLKGKECPKCKPSITSRYSRKAVRWIEALVKARRMKNVQHAENNGEYTLRINGTYMFADGYHERSKTIFEFYGDDFHGNPAKHKPLTRCHPYNSKTARQLYRKTLVREDTLVSLGYRLFVVWESDYNAGKLLSYTKG